MAKKDFDEGAFLQAMSEGHRFGPGGGMPITPVVSDPAEDAPPTASTASRPRRGKVSDYEAVFLAPREPIEKRSLVGVRQELFEVIATIVRRIGASDVNVQAFVENVLRHHLAEHQDEINRLNREKLKKDIVP